MKIISLPLTIVIVMAVALSIDSQATVKARSQSAAQSTAPPPRALLERYCVTCHNQKLKTANFTLEGLDPTQVTDYVDVWEKVVRKLRAGAMPPAGRPRPDKAAYDGLRSWLETQLDLAAAARPNPGRTEPLHRLNRTEYRNVIRDLLALDVDLSAELPADDASYGFDNIAGVLQLSPTLLERYLSAAAKISQLAVGTPVLVPSAETYRLPEDLPQDGYIEGLPFGTRGGTLISHNFPRDGEYEIQVKLARTVTSVSDEIPLFNEPQNLEISVDGERVQVFTLPVDEADEEKVPGILRSRRLNLDANWRVRFPAKAGPKKIAIAFLNTAPALLENLVQPFLRPYPGDLRDVIYYTTRKGAYLRSVDIRGPFEAGGPGNSPSRSRIFTCRPTISSTEAACAKTILTTLARRAYRRAVTDVDLEPLLRFYAKGRSQGGFEAGIERALQVLLVKPEFLFRIERDPAKVAPGIPYHLSDWELASRLSFFLWSSIPDDELLNVASRGTLRNPVVLERQVTRMLADPRSEALVSNFAGQWLYLRNVPGVGPDPRKDPDFDESLRQAFRRETELFFESIIREDRSALDLLTADYTFVNERLARHYGIPNVHGGDFRRVTLTDQSRRGLLGQGSILSVTSYPHRTSPVIRGKWVLENLLGTPPPPPPPNVPDLKDTNAKGEVLTMRERMAQHRANPACASCHAKMDPLGFALENFDLVGRWRTVDESFVPIDASGILPNGTRFEGPMGLRQALLDLADQFVTTVTEKLLTYAVGRGVEYYDAPAVRTIVRHAAQHNYRFRSSLILGIVKSAPFQMRRASAEDVRPTTTTAAGR